MADNELHGNIKMNESQPTEADAIQPDNAASTLHTDASSAAAEGTLDEPVAETIVSIT